MSENKWPEIFDTKAVDGHSNAALCADGLVAWAICETGGKPHTNFGKVLAMIATRLGMAATPENLMKKAKDYE